MIQRTDVATESLTPLAGKRVAIDGELPVLNPDEDEDAHLRRIASWAGEMSRIPSIVTSPVLPALLAAAHAAQETGKPE
jgi:hypothetical protein